jgi:hypothetical protein
MGAASRLVPRTQARMGQERRTEVAVVRRAEATVFV